MKNLKKFEGKAVKNAVAVKGGADGKKVVYTPSYNAEKQRSRFVNRRQE